MSDIQNKVNELEVRLAAMEGRNDRMHEDVRVMIAEMKLLRAELTKGKGIAIGVLMVLGASVTAVYAMWNYFTK